ncbi:hypothetical protein LCGC14_2785690, partial [marine sediment metagenome]
QIERKSEKPEAAPTYHFVLQTLLLHTSGESFESIYPLNPRDPKDPQQMGSVITYARRYTACGMLGIATEDDDGAKASKGRNGSKKADKAPEAKEEVGKESEHLITVGEIRKLDTIKVGDDDIEVYGIVAEKTNILFQTTNPEIAEEARISMSEKQEVLVKARLSKRGLGIISLTSPVAKS